MFRVCRSMALCVTLVVVWPQVLCGQNVTGEQVKAAIQRGIRYLRDQQRFDGSWPEFALDGGTTALACLALINAGVPIADPALGRGLEVVRSIPLEATYVVSLKIQALAAADAKRFAREIQSAADWLAGSQRRRTGMWGYGIPLGGGDFSNTQFALLGLHEAAQAGATVNPQVWRAAERAWNICQQRDGGWGYAPDRSSTGSMTAAGVASLYITGHSLDTRRESGFVNGLAPHCGRYAEYKPIARGLAWLAQRFSPTINPPERSWYYYYLYGVERVGILSGQRYFGRHDWYREGAEQLVRRQGRDGSWEDNSASNVVNTSFALLFLAKGHKSILFHKLQWSADNQWNQDRSDIAHLVGFIGDRLGGPVTWEVVGVDAKVEDWLAAPILYFNGHVFPRFDARAVKKLQEYVRQGGTIIAEACCGRKEFTEGFRNFARQAWPEFDLHPLAADHPVFRSLFRLDGSKIQLEGIEVACRTSIFLSPVDLSCLWEQARLPESQAAFQLGTNLAAYATGLEPLPDRLDVVRLAAKSVDAPASGPVERGAVHIAQLMHSGDWRSDAQIVPNLARHLHEKLGVDVVPQYEPLSASDAKLSDHPIVFMTGHYSFQLSPEEISALRRHLKGGGTLFAESCCGRKAFDTAFREMVRQLFPENALTALPAAHPVLAGSPGVPVPEVSYKPAVLTEQPALRAPMLEGVELDGRTAVIYSPYSLGCSIDGHACFACRGVADPDATSIAANIILYALSY